ncbi:glycosyltransferase family 2 protein [Cyclobacteriaceae bacterium YHN15]|nr:glycosyltransferase family 2 protein [Cyclobacteriaceae bacterium YHN15]
MNQCKVFCIVITYNGIQWLSRHIDSLKKSKVPLEVVFVDNGSIDGTQDFIKTNFHEAYLIDLKENLGFGKANNIGVKYAIENGADFVFLLNQDAYMEESTLSNCLKVLSQADEKVALVSPVHLNGKGSALDIGFQRCISDELCPGYVSDMALNKLKSSYLIYSVNAAAWLLKAEVINKLGLFSEAFFHYGEDINFQQRLKYFGYRALLVTDAFILHDRYGRKGEKSELGKRIEIKTSQMTLLMNINEPFRATLKKVLKYAGLLIFEGKVSKSLSMIFDTFWNRKKYKNWRAEMKKGLSL